MAAVLLAGTTALAEPQAAPSLTAVSTLSPTATVNTSFASLAVQLRDELG
ncbi:MAG: hypothetical protein RL199_1678, partial [Pseudomonadota bacterium]